MEKDSTCAQFAQTSRGICVEGNVAVKILRWKQHFNTCLKKVIIHSKSDQSPEMFVWRLKTNS